MDSQSEDMMITASSKQGAVPTTTYSWRAPSPPHISVPPTPDSNPLDLPPYSGYASNCHEQDVFKVITSDVQHVERTQDWKYESRRQAQCILPFLYLGPSTAAKDTESLKREDISLLLVVRNTRTAQARLLSGHKVAVELGIASAEVDVDDSQELIAAFPRAIDIINSHLTIGYDLFTQAQRFGGAVTWSTWSQKGRVLVFCESGNERSAAVVAAYIMAMYDTNLVTAIQYIQAQRFCVAFDDELKNLLLSYQHILQARKTVHSIRSEPHFDVKHTGEDLAYQESFECGNIASASDAAKVTVKASNKRSRDELADEEHWAMDLDQVDDKERFGNRSFTPFS